MEACAHLGVHKEWSATTHVLVLFGDVEESGHKHLVEGEAWNVTACVDTESVNTHFDKRAVAVDQIFGSGWILGVEVHAVAGYLRIPASVVVPVKLSEMVPIVMRVVILFVGIQGAIEAVACTILGSAVSRALAAAFRQ